METRTRILEAAAGVFTRYGFRQANMELVAAEARLSRQGVYRHFSSKDALFVAMADGLHQRSLHQAEVAAAKAQQAGGDVVDVLVAAVCGRTALHFAFLIDAPHAKELNDEHKRHCGPVIEANRNRFLALLIEIIDRARMDRNSASLAGVSSAEFATDVTIIALGLISVLPPTSPEDFRTNLPRMLRRQARGAAA